MKYGIGITLVSHLQSYTYYYYLTIGHLNILYYKCLDFSISSIMMAKKISSCRGY